MPNRLSARRGRLRAPSSDGGGDGVSARPRVVSVLLVEDHAVVRQGLKVLLESQGDIRVVGEAENGRQAVEMAAEMRPAVILMDIAMPLLNGLEATRQILKANPSARVILLSAHGERAYLETAVQHGAMGYLLKQAPLEVLSRAIHAVDGGTSFFDPFPGLKPDGSADKRVGMGSRLIRVPLTIREAEVLQLIAEGLANKRIASELAISMKTVEKHRHNLMGKLGIHDTAGLTRYAISAGIVGPDPDRPPIP